MQMYHGTVEGLVPGTGSAFALLPPDNATGNFIHIVERVPVRIALPADEIREHPIRPGLSTVTEIDVSAPTQSVWTSLAASSTDEYQTDIYAEELTSAEVMAQDIILANVVTKEHRLDAEQWRKNQASTLASSRQPPQEPAHTGAAQPLGRDSMKGDFSPP